MKTFIILLTSEAIACVIMATLIWIAIFLDEMDIKWTSPIDKLCDHAEKTARRIKKKGDD